MIRLTELIEEKDISQKDLAKALNLAPQTINNYVQGHRSPDYETLGKMCDFFDCSADYFLGRSPIRKPDLPPAKYSLLEAYDAAPKNIQESIELLLRPFMEERTLSALPDGREGERHG